MTRYLTPAWFEEVNRMARTSEALRQATTGARVTLQQVVVDAPGGVVRHWLRVDDGVVEAGLGDAADAHATVTTDYETAVAVHTGRLGADDAILAGRVRVRGDVRVLVEQADALRGVSDALDGVRARTSYES